MNALLTLVSRSMVATLCCIPAVALAAALDFIPDAVVGKPDFTTGRGGAASATRLTFTAAIAQDPISGELWVADFEANRVLRFSSANAFANGEAANLVLGQADFDSSAPNRGGSVAANTLHHPAGLAVDEAQRLYVSDTDNHRLLVFHPPFANGMNATAVVGQANFAAGLPNRGGGVDADTLFRPHGLAIEGAGIALAVADMNNARVLRYPLPIPVGAPASVAGVLGQPDYRSNIPSLTRAGMSRPAGVAFDSLRRLWVADVAFHRLTSYSDQSLPFPGSEAERVICQPNFVSGGAGVTDRACQSPTGLAFGPENRLYVADFSNNRVLSFPLQNDGDVAASDVVGQAGFTEQLCNRNLAAPRSDTLCNPFALLVDRHGNLLVADAGNARVLRYDVPKLRPRPYTAGAGPRLPLPGLGDFDLTIDGRNFFADTVVEAAGQSLPVRYISPSRIVARFPESAVPDPSSGLGIFVSNPQPSSGGSGQTTLGAGSRQAADALPDRVLGLGGLLATVASPGAHGAGSLGGINAFKIGELARGVAIDSRTGRLFVADTSRARVLSWPSYARFQHGESADLVVGQPDFFSARCMPTTARSLCAPIGLAVDDAGRLYVTDSNRHRILRFDPPFATGMAAASVFGQGGSFTTGEDNKGGRGPGSLSFPAGLAYGNGRLFVADAGNARVLAYDNPAADTTADAVLGRGDMVSGPGGDPSATRIGIDLVGLGVDGAGRLFVADTGNHRVLRFSPPFANGMAADLVIGQQDFASRGFGNTERTLRSPDGIAADAEGNLVVSDRDNHRVLRFAAPLAIGMAAGAVLGQPGLDTSDLQAGPERTTAPTGVAVDAAGNVLVVGSGDQRVLAYDRPFGVETTKRLVNIATRMPVLQGDDVLIGGFIIGGTAPKKVVVRARGPSLGQFGIANPLANPLLQLFSGANAIAANDNWQQAANVAEIQASGFAPAHPFESAILMTLQPGPYTAIVSGAGGVTGVGIVEVFEVDGNASPLVNIATRGRVLTGDNVLIGGFVIAGDSPQTVVIRARGPSLAAAGVPNPLANPLLRLFAGDGTVLLTNDDWTVAPNAVAIQASGFAPSSPVESAILVTLSPGAYTAVVSGPGGATGLAIVEVFVP